MQLTTCVSRITLRTSGRASDDADHSRGILKAEIPPFVGSENVFHILIFTSVCVIVVYACIAFRDDPCAIVPWDSYIERDQAIAMGDLFSLAVDENPPKPSARKLEPAVRKPSLPMPTILSHSGQPLRKAGSFNAGVGT